MKIKNSLTLLAIISSLILIGCETPPSSTSSSVSSSISSISSSSVSSSNTSTSSSSSSTVNPDEQIKINIIEEGTDEAALEIAKKEARDLYLNVDTTNIVASLKLPTTGSYLDTEIIWKSSNIKVLGHNGLLKTTRDTTKDYDVVLTATVSYHGSKVTREFNVHVPALEAKEPLLFPSIIDDFSDYVTGRELSYYYDWDLTSGSNAEGNGISKIVEQVENNNMISSKAVSFPSYRLSANMQYDRYLDLNENFSMEAYVMFTGEINGLFFEFIESSSRAVSAGFTDQGFQFYQNKDFITSSRLFDEGVWTKIRVDVDMSNKTYTYSYYDWYTNELTTIAENVAMANKINKVTKFRIRVASGQKNGCSYLSNLVIDKNIPVNIGTNPNRTMGIGKIHGFNEDVLLVQGEAIPTPELEIYNRFNRSQKLEPNVDYTIEASGINDTNTTGAFEKTYKVTLKSTNEIKELSQNIYIDDPTSPSKVRTLKSSSIYKNSITIYGSVSKLNSDVYYLIVPEGSPEPTAAQVKAGVSYNNTKIVSKGVLENCTGSFNIKVSNIDETIVGSNETKNEYDLYLVTDHKTNGLSDVYTKQNISSIVNIETCDDFYAMTNNPDTNGYKFRLMNDLDFSNYEWYVNPLDTMAFTGELDGQGYTVKNLTINNEHDGNVVKMYGIFYQLKENAYIHDIKFENANITSYEDTGLIAGYSYGATLENIEIDGLVMKATPNATGAGHLAALFGRVDKGETIINNVSVINAEIITYKYSGCFTAYNQYCDLLTITNSIFIGKVTNDGAYIGLVGRNYAPLKVENCIIYITVETVKKQAGLIAGHTNITGSNNGIITADNVVGNFIVKEILQPTYMNSGVGEYATDGDIEEQVKITDFYTFYQDYSILAEEWEPILNSINKSKVMDEPEEFTKDWWTTNTFFKDYEELSSWYYDEELDRPNLNICK